MPEKPNFRKKGKKKKKALISIVTASLMAVDLQI